MFNLEPLESRQLFAGTLPSNLEQYFVELVNRARANPAAEAKRYGISLNEGLTAGTLTNEPRQPLAISPFLITAGRNQATYQTDPVNPHDGMLDHLDNGTSDPCSRTADAGFPGVACGENLAWVTHNGSSPTQEDVDRSHKILFMDFIPGGYSVLGRGHRLLILSGTKQEVGIGVVLGNFSGKFAQVSAEEYGNPVSGADLTGVIYTDKISDDDFYTPGEGLGKINITATRQGDNAVFKTKTWASGGYTLNLQPGTYNVTAHGTALGKDQTYYNVVIGSQNVKRDFVKPGTSDKTAPTASLIAQDLTLAGDATHTFTVTYNDTAAIKSSTIGNGDIQVTAPGGYSRTATLVTKSPGANGISIVATYSITAPDSVGGWSAADNKTYTVKMLPKQVSDLVGGFVAKGVLGTFTVNII